MSRERASMLKLWPWRAARRRAGGYSLFILGSDLSEWASGANDSSKLRKGGPERRRDDTSGHITELLDSEMGRQTGPLNRDMWMHAGLESWLVEVGGGVVGLCMDVLFYQRPRCVFCIAADWKALIFPPISFYRITDRDCSTCSTRVDSLFLIWEKS